MQAERDAPIFRLATCTVRPWRPTDGDALVRNANNRKVWIQLRDRFPHPYTPADAREWLAYAGGMIPPTHFAIEVEGEAVGGVGFEIQPDVFGRSAEIGYWLGEEHWGRGIMTEAATAITEHAFACFDLIRLFAGVFSSNPPSARVLEKAGYRREARLEAAVFKDGRVLDQWMYARIKGG